ncbi:MAG: hypothetical protein Kow00121_57560 [Elainellaceae cyanobacterium]
MGTQWQRYKELELISESEPNLCSSRSTKQTWLNGIWQILDLALFRDLEPRMWQSIDQSGQTNWYIYDPKTGHTLHLSSDAQIRLWLEMVFYQG